MIRDAVSVYLRAAASWTGTGLIAANVQDHPGPTAFEVAAGLVTGITALWLTARTVAATAGLVFELARWTCRGLGVLAEGTPTPSHRIARQPVYDGVEDTWTAVRNWADANDWASTYPPGRHDATKAER